MNFSCSRDRIEPPTPGQYQYIWTQLSSLQESLTSRHRNCNVICPRHVSWFLLWSWVAQMLMPAQSKLTTFVLPCKIFTAVKAGLKITCLFLLFFSLSTCFVKWEDLDCSFLFQRLSMASELGACSTWSAFFIPTACQFSWQLKQNADRAREGGGGGFRLTQRLDSPSLPFVMAVLTL